MELTETTRTILTQFTDEVIGMLLATLAFLFLILFIYRLYTRRRLRSFFHQIPASEVKNYLDSIISNGHALKSSFSYREGFDLENRTPSVLPLADLPSSGINTETKIPSEELSQKDAEIASLKSQIGEKNKTVHELEEMLSSARTADGGNSQEEEKLKNEIQELKSKLEQAPDGKSEQELENAVKERNKLKERLDEYELIEEDLANLKRFQEENQKLKEELEALRNSPLPTDNNVAEEAPSKENPPQEEAVNIPQENRTQEEVAQTVQGNQAQEQEEAINVASGNSPQEESVSMVKDPPKEQEASKKIQNTSQTSPEEESLKKILDVTEVINTPKEIVKGENINTDENVVHRISGENVESPEKDHLIQGQQPSENEDDSIDSKAKSLSEVLDENAITDLDDDPTYDLKSDKLEKEESEVPANEGNQKSAEELLSEFEKMLG